MFFGIARRARSNSAACCDGGDFFLYGGYSIAPALDLRHKLNAVVAVSIAMPRAGHFDWSFQR